MYNSFGVIQNNKKDSKVHSSLRSYHSHFTDDWKGSYFLFYIPSVAFQPKKVALILL